MGEAGDERRQRDEHHDRDEEVPAAVGARRRSGFVPRARDAPAVGVQLHGEAQRQASINPVKSRKGWNDKAMVVMIFCYTLQKKRVSKT